MKRKIKLPVVTRFHLSLSLQRSSAVVHVNQNFVRSSTRLGGIARARVIAARRQWIRASGDVSAVRGGLTAVALLVVLGAAVLEAAVGTSIQAVGNRHVGGATGDTLGGGQQAAVGVVDVAAHEVPCAVACACEELLLPGAVDSHGEAVTGAAVLGLVACARHIAVGGGGGGGRNSVAAPALVAVLGSGILVAKSSAVQSALARGVGAARSVRVW